MGGLHRFISWPRGLLTDSGGFQVFSLSQLRKVSDEGVRFRSHLDGSSHFFTPEHSMDVQIALGADIAMAFDECTEYPADRKRRRKACGSPWPGPAARSTTSAPIAKKSYGMQEFDGRTQSLFGIVQGGMYRDLRRESAERLVEMDFDGYAIGGLSVGEPRDLTLEMISEVLPLLPANKPRYVMGVGYPDEIEQYARMGVDMMDCVLPTRAARHGLLFTSEGRLNIKGKRYAEDQNPPDPACDCMVCRRYTRAYLRHLMQAGEALSGTLNSIHNLAYYLGIMNRVNSLQHSSPVARRSLSKQARCRIPRRRLNFFHPSPVGKMRQQNPHRLAHCAGEMSDACIGRDHQIQNRHQRRRLGEILISA
jgi:queuine tRNA-ribosyltransferase